MGDGNIAAKRLNSVDWKSIICWTIVTEVVGKSRDIMVQKTKQSDSLWSVIETPQGFQHDYQEATQIYLPGILQSRGSSNCALVKHTGNEQ